MPPSAPGGRSLRAAASAAKDRPRRRWTRARTLAVLFAALFVTTSVIAIWLALSQEEAPSRALELETRPFFGPRNPSFALVVFLAAGDNASRAFYNAEFWGIYRESFETGKFHVVLKHAVGGEKAWSEEGAVAVECVWRLRNNELLNFVGKLYSQYDSIPEDFRAWATAQVEASGLRAAEFHACLDGPEARERVHDDAKDAAAFDVGGPPGLLLVGRETERAFVVLSPDLAGVRRAIAEAER